MATIQCKTIDAKNAVEYDEIFALFAATFESLNQSLIISFIVPIPTNRITQTIYYFTIDNPTPPPSK